jgi:PAS domain S-box-containing protein
MGKMSESVVVRRCQMFSNIAAWIAIIAGSTVLAGWWLHVTSLTSIVPGLVTMKPNTALSFLLSGVALWLLRRQPAGSQRPARAEKIAARVCAAVVLCIGTVSFIERLTNRDLGIDLLLFRDTLLATGVPHPGLMAAASGLAFLLLGGAILLLDFETSRKSNPAQALALGVVVIGFVALLGYVYGVQLLYGVSGYSAVALHTAPIFVLLGAAVLCSRPDRGLMSVLTSDRLGGLMARRLLPIFVLLPLLVGWLRLHGQRARWYQPEFGSALFSGGYVVLLAILIWICALWLNRADAARRRAEDRDEEMAAIVNSSSDAIVGKTLDGTITSWNRGAEQIYGYKEEEVLGKNISVLVPPGQLDDIPRFMAEVRKGFSIERFETIRRRKDKVLIHVSLTISPVHDREGNVVGASSVARDITARKQAEERLSQSQAQLRGIIDSAMDAVITVDQNQNVVMFNAAAEKMFGYSSQEVVGLPLERLIPQKFRTGHAEHIHNFSKTGTTSRAMGALGALQGLRANGEEFPIEASISQIESNGKKFFTAIVRDVTERLRADLALREQASVLDLTQVMVRDMDGRIVLWNRGAEKLYGYKLEEALGRISHELLHTEFPEPEDLINKKLIDSGEWEGELVHRKRDGTKIVVASVWTLERHMSGRPWRILEANTDITARKRAEDAVQLAQARLLSALEGGRMGTWVWEIGTNRIVWDDPMRSLFGRDPDDITGGSIEPFFSWLHPQDRERTRAILETSLREGSSYDAEYRISRPDQSIVWIAARGRVERDAQGNAFRMTGVCIDITDRKRMEEQLLQAQKMQALGTLAGGIAHDFNNILMAIGGNASLAIDEIPADHPVQRNLHEISKASSRASNLVRQILAFSRRQAPDRKHIAVQPAVEEALGLLRATLPARIDIRSSFSPDLPPISADSTQLHQVIMNLGTNAARAIGEQRGVLEVVARPFNVTEDIAASIGKLREGSYVRLSVSDSGCGINPAIIERIFEPFFTTQAPGQGTGLGLSVAHGIMKDHDGAISVYSEHGKGSVFHLYFPAAAEFANKAATHTAPQRGHGEHLLYIDDEEALVMLATRSLGKLGYQITGHTEPVKALQAFKENPHRFAAVVTDLSMPGMSGAELARKVIEIRPDVPIVMTSGYIRPEDEVEAKQIGVRELILKPDSIDELAKALHRVFAGSAHAGTPSQPA